MPLAWRLWMFLMLPIALALMAANYGVRAASQGDVT